MNDRYASGEIPEVGDIVRLNGKYSYDYHLLSYSKSYKVKAIFKGIASTLIEIETFDRLLRVKASSFDLIESLANDNIKKPEFGKYLIIANAKPFFFNDIFKAEQYAKKLLEKSDNSYIYKLDREYIKPKPQIIMKVYN